MDKNFTFILCVFMNAMIGSMNALLNKAFESDVFNKHYVTATRANAHAIDKLTEYYLGNFEK